MHYRAQADRDAYCTLAEESSGRPWQPPPGFTIDPDPRSRFYDPTSPVDPLLPGAGAALYAYSLPDLPAREPSRFRRGLSATASHPDRPIEPLGPPAVQSGREESQEAIRLVTYQRNVASADADPATSEREDISLSLAAAEELRVTPIPADIWDSLPVDCLTRMFEFLSIRREYQRSFGQEPRDEQRDRSRRLALEDVVDLALLNSREYQAQKETLYSSALRLTLERYDYDLKFAATGNRTEVDYTHTRTAGVTENNLHIPTAITGDQVLATGGDLLARFANDVVLTFNGPDGFAADIGSELLFDVSQSVFQRDVLFEALTQAERDVVYAAREFARYRKTLFNNLARQYYNLLLSYRTIEIDSLDYFSQLRGFHRSQAEYRAGRLPRFQVDQFEQSSLNSRSRLITDCNTLERSLDTLKLQLGLPTELPLNLDLLELEELTLRDEATAGTERVRRSRRNLLTERQQPAPERGVLLNAAADLVDKMLKLAELRERLDHPQPGVADLEILRDQLAVDQAHVDVRLNRAALGRELQAQPPAPPLRVFQRTMDLVDTLLTLNDHRLTAAERQRRTLPPNLPQQRQTFTQRYERARSELERTVTDRQLDRIPELRAAAEGLLADIDRWTADVEALLQVPARTEPQELQDTLAQVDRLLAESEGVLNLDVGGLTPVQIDADEALLTALALRLDLMNERGKVGDAWRQIKITGDDLKSILNLQATQRVSSRSDVNRPFDFTFDDSQTRLRMTFDAPFNRRAQRNRFRQSLINYNRALRNLMALEDNLKFAVRDDLRNLTVNREQYRIAVASTALAYERVVSTRLQLILGIQKVTARDVLESLQAYTNALNSMARAHINYLLERIDLFLDLELLEVDDANFWPHVYDDRYQPIPNIELPGYAYPVYGELPRGVWYSHKMKRLLQVPQEQTMVYGPEEARPSGPELLPAPAPEQP